MAPTLSERGVVLGKKAPKQEKKAQAPQRAASAQEDESAAQALSRKGHGRQGAAAYTGAKREKVPHPTLRKGAPCDNTAGCKGKMCRFFEPKVLVRIEGTPPLSAAVYELVQ